MIILASLLWLACAVATVVIAKGKNRSGCLWFFLAVLFGPIALLVAAAMSEGSNAPRQNGRWQ